MKLIAKMVETKHTNKSYKQRIYTRELSVAESLTNAIRAY